MARMMEKKPEVQVLPSMADSSNRKAQMQDEYIQGWMHGKQGKMPNIECSGLFHQGWSAGRDARRRELNITIYREPKHKPRLWEPGEVEAELKRREEEDEAKRRRWRESAVRAALIA